ncbi:hypothetical protein ScPMuIL_011320 [Solemya velum]
MFGFISGIEKTFSSSTQHSSMLIGDAGSNPHVPAGDGILLFILTYEYLPADGHGTTGYFNETSQVLLPMKWDPKARMGFSFRTCSDGQLLYQEGDDGDFLKLNLSQGSLHFYWKVDSDLSSVYTEGDFTRNKWFTVDFRFYLGQLWLNVSQGPSLHSSKVVANSTFHTSLWNVNLHGHAGLVVGNGFTGCVMQGPNLIFLGQSLIPKDISWTNSSCPVVDLNCSDGDTDGDDCWSNPCKNGGTCIDGLSNHTCVCPHLFNGTSCENDLSIYGCAVDPCLNDGTCEVVTNGSKNYRCQCLQGFNGNNCQNNINECLSELELCKNGGQCEDRVNNFSCNCNGTGFEGSTCEDDINECDTVTCGIGTCFNNPGSYRCHCPSGFDGPNCAQNIDECLSNPCKNDGTCHNLLNGFECYCIQGYTGVQCDTNIDDCVNVTCPVNSSCTDLVEDYICRCEPGYTGTPPDCLEINECETNPCMNNATCQNLINEYRCDCVDGFDGKNCSNNIDDCSPDPCENGAKCVDEVADFHCVCFLGYSGKNCSVNIDECILNNQPCQNGGTCVDKINEYTCNCSDGWKGDNCTQDIDECEFDPCKNGGTCQNFPSAYNCTCAAGYRGFTCSEDINECMPDQCQNNATCLDLVNAFKCNCMSGWMGVLCDLPYNACSFDPCQNGGNCSTIVPESDFRCDCIPGFEGDTCSVNIDDCAGGPCDAPLKCYDGINNYTCACEIGYEGENCTEEIDECASEPCKNGATCTHGIGFYNCTCPQEIIDLTEYGGRTFITGYHGEKCDIDINECDYTPSICMNNGVCDNQDGTYQCTCDKYSADYEYYTGAHCELSVSYCSSGNECENGATCVSELRGYRCECVPGYKGDYCEIDIDECQTNPCQYNGTCDDLINDYKCNCIPGITGKDCEIDIDDCSPNPCNNSGQCIDHINDFTCNCSDTGFDGRTCDHNIDDCISSACEHGGHCMDGIKSYTCDCLEGYSGTLCEFDIDECAVSPCINGSCFQRSNQALYDGRYPGLLNFSYETAAGYMCVCIRGFTGKDCEIDIDDCVNHTCQNGATCRDGWNKYSCDCAPGYRDAFCSVEIDECVLYNQPCMNGGTCQDKVADYECHCPELYNKIPYSGRNCTVELTACNNNMCQNYIDCKPFLLNEKTNMQDYTCVCQHGYSGRYCTNITTMSFKSGSNIRSYFTKPITSISLRFQTTLSEGILLVWPSPQSNFLTIEIHDSYLYIGYHGNNGFEFIHFDGYVNTGDWQQVEIARSQSLYVTLLNSVCTVCSRNLTLGASPTISMLDVGDIMYSKANTISKTPYVGCMQDLKVNGDMRLPTKNDNCTIGCNRTDQCFTDSCNSHGTCDDLWHSYSCTCQRPYLGTDCNLEYTAVTFAFENQESSATFEVPESEKQNLQTFINLSMFIRTREDNGLILIFGDISNSYLTLELVQGYIASRFKVCNTMKAVHSLRNGYDNGLQHFVKITANITSNTLQLSIDDSQPIVVELNLDSSCLFSAEKLVFGGKISNEIKRQKREVIDVIEADDALTNTRFFKGTIQDVELNNFKLQFYPVTDANNSNVPSYDSPVLFNVTEGEKSDDVCSALLPCENNSTCENVFFNNYKCICTFGYRGRNCSKLDFCVDVSCPDKSTCQSLNDGYECISTVTFDGGASLVSWKSDLSQNSQINKLSLRMRTEAMNGVLLLMKSDEEFFEIDVVGGHLQITYGTAKSNRKEIHAPGFISDGIFHNISIETSIEFNTSLVIDGNGSKTVHVSLDDMVNLTLMIQSPHNEILMGHIKPDSALYYKGCVSEFRLGDVLLPFFFDNQFQNNTATNKFLMQQKNSLVDGCVGGSGCQYQQCMNEAACVPDYYSYICKCEAGYTGQWCHINEDDCGSHECGEHGVCIDGIHNYTCACKAGYTGDRCESSSDTCSSITCANNESCINSSGISYCNCTEDFVGKLCNRPATSNCTENPCLYGTCNQMTDGNDAVSITYITGFNCTCPRSYFGDLCEFRENYCGEQPCGNGNCTSDYTIFNYTCDCPAGYTGSECDQVIDYCADDSCLNGGECISTPNGLLCNCTDNWDGENCSVDVDECDVQQPCQNNASCNNTPGSYDCDCYGTGYKGKYCSENVDECHENQPCQHNANCTDIKGSYICDCTNGYEDQNCSTPNCSQVVCQNTGTCNVKGSDWICQCLTYYEGELCELRGPCVDEPCNKSNSVAAACSQNLSGFPYTYTCQCNTGWRGQNCSEDINECIENNPCVNGTCVNTEGDYECNCTAGFEDKNCSTNTDDCTPEPCNNSGVCTDEVNGFNCNCSNTGYQGDTCMDDIDECSVSQPCKNQGTCQNTNGSFQCQCTEQYTGDTCAETDPRYEAVTSNDDIWLIIGPVVAAVLLIIIIVLVIFLKVARKKRATRGAYSPSRQEMSGSRVELGNVMKQPPEERLI